MIVVRAYPRLHVGLVDLGNATSRRYGGAGFMLDCLTVEVTIEAGSHAVRGLALLDRRSQADVMEAIKRQRRAFPVKPTRISIRCVPPQHIGLGSKTALILAVLKACALSSQLQISSKHLQMLSGRGGTSGVGIHGFFKGGFVIDAGHRSDLGTHFAPSAFQRGFEIPPLLSRITVPAGWRFALILPKGRRYSGAREMKFFRENTPVPKFEVKETMAILHHGIAPAVLEDDISTLRIALREMHRCGFKRRELRGQAPPVRRLFDKLEKIPDCAVGLSSMGPLLYVVMKEPTEEVLDGLAAIVQKEGASLLGVCAGRNRGYEVLG